MDRRIVYWGCSMALFATLLAAMPGVAYELRAFAGKSRKACVEDFTPRGDRPENKHNKFFSEQYSFDGSTEGGGNLWFQVVISNMSIANGRAALRVSFTPPGGKKTTVGQVFEAGAWSHQVDGDTLTLKLGESTLSGDGRSWKVHLVTDKLSADCTVTNSIPAWRPGGGAAYYGAGEKSYYEVTLLTPHGKFVADVTPSEGEKTHLEGWVFGDYSVINVAPNLQARAWIKMRKVTAKSSVVFTAFQTSEQYGSGVAGWFVVASDKRIVATAVNPKLEFSDNEVDEPTGYQVPRMILMSGAEGVKSFEGVIKAVKRTKRQDKLAELSAIEKAVVGKIVRPVSFSHKAEFEMKFEEDGKKRTVSGKATYHYEQMTK